MGSIATAANRYRFSSWVTVFGMPLLILVCYIVDASIISPKKSDILLLTIFYIVSISGVEIGYHRYLIHRSFQCGKILEGVLVLAGASALQGPPIFWAVNHRRHHAFTDKSGDPHSPLASGGFLHAHIGWILNCPPTSLGDLAYGRDLLSRTWVGIGTRWYYLIATVGVLLPGLISLFIELSIESFMHGVLWGGVIRIVAVHHAFWLVNSLGHLKGGRTFETNDNSRNNWVLALFTMGAGLHNNHHAHPGSYFLDFRWWQIDPSAYLIRLFVKLGLVWNLRLPNPDSNQKI